jgi:hypothetical protein
MARQSKMLMREDCMTGWMLVKGQREAVNLDLICVRVVPKKFPIQESCKSP